MSKIQNEIKKEIQIMRLEAQVLRHKKLYYQGIPEIADSTYDFVEAALRELAPDSPVLEIVGSEEGL